MYGIGISPLVLPAAACTCSDLTPACLFTSRTFLHGQLFFFLQSHSAGILTRLVRFVYPRSFNFNLSRRHRTNTPQMPSRSPRKGKARYSDPSNASLTPLTGAFSRLSTSSRAQSLSPHKKDAKQPLHIRMNLTETQMNKITDAYVGETFLPRVRLITEDSPDRSMTTVLPKIISRLLPRTQRKSTSPLRADRRAWIVANIMRSMAKVQGLRALKI